MVQALIARLRAPLLGVVLLSFPAEVLAHRLEGYLQATVAVIEPGCLLLQVNLTPGVDVASRILASMDTDRDHQVSKKEAAAYSATLKRDITLTLDGRKLKLKLNSSKFPTHADLRTGHGIIQLEFSAEIDELTTGTHKLAIQNRHLPKLSVYLLNAAQPRSATIQVTRQNRTKNQSAGEIEFIVQPK